MSAEKPVRKFPPPCWSQDEALALIEAYRERWYALRRGYLRTPDWDSVAEQVGSSCPGAVPAKTSAQCRHKMEKLRQRYRAEKQRSQSFPGRFFSSWFYYEAMDAMEHGSGGEGNDPANPVNPILKVVNFQKKDQGSNPNSNFDQTGLNPGRGIRFKPVGDRSLVTPATRLKNSSKNGTNMKSAPNFGSRVSNLDFSAQYLDSGNDKEEEEEVEEEEEEEDGDEYEYEDGFAVETPIEHNSGYRGSRSHKNSSSQGYPPRFPFDIHGGDGDDGGGFRGKGLVHQDSERSSGLRPRKFSKMEKVNPNFWDDGSNINNQVDEDGELWVKVPRDRSNTSGGFRGKYSGKMERNSNLNFDTSGFNGHPSAGKKSGGGGGGGIKKENVAVSDMVSSIKLLGDGFMKMEKMKVEMVSEIEKMRMETDMKRNELILESQKQIVDAFVKGIVEGKKRKQKPAAVVTTES